MNVPNELQYSKDHEWVRLDGGRARIGITDYAQDALGDVVFVSLPATGAAVVAASTCAEVESTKSVSDIYAPVGGTIVEVVYQGVSTQYVIRTDTGDTIVAFHQNSERVRDAGVPGSRTRLVWDPQHNVVLAGDPALPPPIDAPRQEELVT